MFKFIKLPIVQYYRGHSFIVCNEFGLLYSKVKRKRIQMGRLVFFACNMIFQKKKEKSSSEHLT